MSERTDLYRFWNSDGELLYVGISLSAVDRASSHRSAQPWWHEVATMTVEHLNVDRAGALAIEMYVIKTEMPRYNLLHNNVLEHARVASSACECVSCGGSMLLIPMCQVCRSRYASAIDRTHWMQLSESLRADSNWHTCACDDGQRDSDDDVAAWLASLNASDLHL